MPSSFVISSLIITDLGEAAYHTPISHTEGTKTTKKSRKGAFMPGVSVRSGLSGQEAGYKCARLFLCVLCGFV